MLPPNGRKLSHALPLLIELSRDKRLGFSTAMKMDTHKYAGLRKLRG